MASRPEKDNLDSWYGVLDPRKRKQIQNRLAQRARRKRLSEASRNSGQLPIVERRADEATARWHSTNCGLSVVSNSNANIPPCADVSSLWLTPGTENSCYITLAQGRAYDPPLSCDQHFLPSDPKVTAIIALTENGSILGLTCSRTELAKSSPQPSTIPQSLYPTPLQLSTPHYDWIDRLPFPRMRDNMIILVDVVDPKDILCDFFTMPSFSVRAGAASWDPAGWLVSHQFNEKWGYLFH